MHWIFIIDKTETLIVDLTDHSKIIHTTPRRNIISSPEIWCFYPQL
jgi:protein associated with RNAse G/E